MRRRQALGHALALILAFGIAGCAEEPPAPAPVLRPIKMLTVGGGFEGTREYPGRIRAAQQVDMAFEVPGRITEFVYKEGQLVEKDGLLARIDPREYQNSLRKAIAMSKQARTYLARIQKAHETRAVSDQDLNNAEARVEVADAEVRIRRKTLDDTKLLAPFEGIMSLKLLEDFANVEAKQPVLIFEDTTHLEIKVSIPERDLSGRRREGETPASVTERIKPELVVTSQPDERIPCRLKEIATHADPATRTYQATFAFENPTQYTVLPGMTARVIVHLPRDARTSGILVPAQAADADPQGDSTVWLVDPDSMAVRRRPVELGELQGDNVIVKSGLSNGDIVAISGVAQLREGMIVRRWETR